MMPAPETRRDGTAVVQWLVAAASIVLIVAGLRFASYVVAPLFLAFMLTAVIAPAVRRLEGMGLPTWLAIVCVLVIAIALLVAFLFLVSLQLTELSQKLPEYRALMEARLEEMGASLERRPPTDPAVVTTATETTSAVIQAVGNALSSLLSGVVLVVFFLFLLALMLSSERSFSRILHRVIAEGSDFHRRFNEYVAQIQIQGRIRTASNLMSGVVLGALFLLFRIDFALLWGMLAFVLGYIPNIGLILACVPAVILAFIQYGLGTALVVLAFAIILNASVDNIVIPRFIVRSSQLPMVIVFIGFVFWGWMFGLLGAIISTQATLLVRALLDAKPETRALAQLMKIDRDPAQPQKAASRRRRLTI
jgi:predicted PurR-regulated permease PerM